MFRRNDQHLQWPLISDLDALPPKLKERLDASWAGTFYRQVLVRLDEDPFAVLYSDEASRPNIPINVLVGLETLKAGFGWSDEEMYENFCFNLQVRYALGYRQLDEGHFELRTLYNFRQRLSKHRQASGEDLMAQAFEQVTGEQLAAFGLKTSKLRMDSTQVASNIRQFSRLQLLVEVLQRVHRDLNEADHHHYGREFEPYLQGSAGQYTYRLKPDAYASHLEQIGQVMAKLVTELAATYAQQPSYQLLVRVFNEHFISEVDDQDQDDDDHCRPRQGDELSADSLQSPDDGTATYRQKRGEEFTGYVANLTETCHPENPFQLIVDLQTEPNTTDDAAMLAQRLPALKKRTGLAEMHTDGGYNSPTVDQVMRQEQVEQVQTAIRGRQPDPHKLNLDDFAWELDLEGQPLALTAPTGQRAEVVPGRKPDRYLARFNQPSPSSSPAATLTSTKPNPPPVLYFSQQQLELALRRQRSTQARADGGNLRPAIEATVGALKRPFNNDKLPVRGQFRVHLMLLGSALMVNLRRIQRYQTAKNHQQETEKGQPDSQNPSFSLPFVNQIRLVVYHLSFVLRFSPVHS